MTVEVRDWRERGKRKKKRAAICVTKPLEKKKVRGKTAVG